MTDLCDAYELHAEIIKNNSPFSVGESYLVELSIKLFYEYYSNITRPVSLTGGHHVEVVSPGSDGWLYDVNVYHRDVVNGDILTTTIHADKVNDQRKVAKCNAKPENSEKDVKNVTKDEGVSQ